MKKKEEEKHSFSNHIKRFFVLIGILSPIYMVGAFIAGLSNMDSWGYYISHNIYILLIIFLLFLTAIFISYKFPE